MNCVTIGNSYKNKIEKMTDVLGFNVNQEDKQEIHELIKEDLKEIVSNIYQVDIDSIRNLEKIATTLQKEGLTIPGNLTVSGKLTVDKDTNLKSNLTVEKNTDTKGQTTINSLYGGKSTGGGWRDITVNGGHVRFVVGTNKFGFHNNNNGLHYYKNDNLNKIPIAGGIDSKGNINVNDYISTRRLDVRNDAGVGTSSFNKDLKGKNYIAGKSFFKQGAQFHGWSGYVTKNNVEIPSGYDSHATLIKGPNENGNVYLGSIYKNRKYHELRGSSKY